MPILRPETSVKNIRSGFAASAFSVGGGKPILADCRCPPPPPQAGCGSSTKKVYYLP